MLKPESFAYNINRIRNVVRHTSYKPNALILGTSVAYQGILTPNLNKLAAKYGTSLRYQNAASQGALIETQHALLRDLAPSLTDVKWIIHVAEVNFPYQTRYELEPANRSMLAQFPRATTIDLLKEQQFVLSPRDYGFFYLRTLTYQGDLRDFVLNPPRRLKDLARAKKKMVPDTVYLNRNKYSIEVYGKTAAECTDHSLHGVGFFDTATGEQVTDNPHRTAVLDTCRMALDDPKQKLGADTWRSLFFERLKSMHAEARRNNMQIVTVFAPYSEMVLPARQNDRLTMWQDELSKGDYFPYIIDLRNSLDGPKNLSYFYDTIHLNESGAEKFTEIFEEAIRQFLAKQDQAFLQQQSTEAIR
ncbi:MAG: hypothetical protein H3C43_04590 [Leptonema sp. (in: Bacteria)]|nr:hypothetical protein [Leptonema sp. (in: bacteria)]